MSRILIAEDEGRIASFIEKGLRSNGFVTTVMSDGASALVAARSGEFDLMILDIGIPKMDGFEVLNEIRSRGSVLPVIILTARSDVRDTVAGFEGGADDYITKPFRFEELLARVRARLRGERAREKTVLRVGDCALDLRTRRVQVGEKSLELTAREFTMAETFFRHPGQVLSREQLLSHVWGYDHDPGSNVVDVYVGYLRRKLGEDRIETVRGMGYRVTESVGGDADGETTLPWRRVLLVEDDPRVAAVVVRALSGKGTDVLVAEDGEAGRTLGTTEELDAVVLDLSLPAVPGVDVLRAIRERHPDLPVLVLTASDDPTLRAECIEAGASGFLTKPFSIGELRGALRAQMSGAAGT